MAALETIQALLQTAREHKRTLIMGVLNLTPDSFSDGGRFETTEEALAAAERMLADGADILDIGGESTRPATFASNAPLPPDEEKRRILPIIAALAARFPDTPISVDTYKACVASAALEAGAVFINDISALRADPVMAGVVAGARVPVCLMQMPGLPTNMPRNPHYGDVVADVRDHLAERANAARSAGIAAGNIVLDPGFGFGKSVRQNLELIRRLGELADLGYPLLMGPSRKSTIGKVLGGLPPSERLEGTAAAVAICIANGAAIVRVHDVKEMVRVAIVADAIMKAPEHLNT